MSLMKKYGNNIRLIASIGINLLKANSPFVAIDQLLSISAFCKLKFISQSYFAFKRKILVHVLLKSECLNFELIKHS